MGCARLQKMLDLLAGTLRPVPVVNGNELSGRQEKEFFLYLVSGLECFK